MSEQEPVQASTATAVPEGYVTWNDYWTRKHNQSWRTEPEIDKERQQFLAKRAAQAQAMPIRLGTGKRMYFPPPLHDDKLTRADVEWLLATHNSGGMHGPIFWHDVAQRERAGIDVRGADLRGVDLSQLPLARLQGSSLLEEWLKEDWPLAYLDNEAVHLEGANLSGAHLEAASLLSAHLTEANLHGAHLEGAKLWRSHLDGANLSEAHLESSTLRAASLSGADCRWAHFEGALLIDAHLEGVKEERSPRQAISTQFKELSVERYEYISYKQTFPSFRDTLGAWPPANLTGAFFDASSALDNVVLGEQKYGFVSAADAHWNGVNLAVVKWRDVTMLGDERLARERKDHAGKRTGKNGRLGEYEAAVRANRQLATALRSQGLNEDADKFAYRAQRLQRQVARQQGRYTAVLGSWLLDAISGYGYKPMRSLIAYAIIVCAFAAAYLVNAQFAAPHLTWDEALVLSISAFHGRGFFTSGISLGDTLARLAAGEAIIGLLIEITFIATFTQRFFAR